MSSRSQRRRKNSHTHYTHWKLENDSTFCVIMTNIPSKRTQSAATPPCRIKLKWLILFCIVFYILGLWIVNVGVHSNTSTSTSTISATPATVQRIESSHPDFPREPQPRPPLKSIVQGWNITGDPSWLLNLAIIGVPKTGTSTCFGKTNNGQI